MGNSAEELERLLMIQPREGAYCKNCRLYQGTEDCAPFEITRNDSIRLTQEYMDRYFKLTSCPYLKEK